MYAMGKVRVGASYTRNSESLTFRAPDGGSSSQRNLLVSSRTLMPATATGISPTVDLERCKVPGAHSSDLAPHISNLQRPP
jgi:hypothetical protein